MIFAIVAGIILILVIVLTIIGFCQGEDAEAITIGFVGILLVILIGVWGFAIPSNHYDAPAVVSETEIVTLSNTVASEGSGGPFYVSIDSENVYSYRVKINTEIAETGETAYEVKTIGGDDEKVIEIETTDGSKPRLTKYVKNGHPSVWSVGLDEVIYVFYVPEGTISRTITLT